MELQEHRHQNGDDTIEHVGYLDHDIGDQLLLVALFGAEVVSVERPLDALEPGEAHGDYYEVGDDEHVDQQQDEKFAVPESNAIVNPGAVMVHVEHAPIAR